MVQSNAFSDSSLIGPLMVDVEGLRLTDEDRTLLANPLVGGVILFSRNYADHQQLHDLISGIRLCNENLLIAVDHEGGRVQRFRDGFTRIPPMRYFGELYASNKVKAIALAKECGWLFASELRAFDIDFSFAPVLDLDYGVSSVIGDRAFSGDACIVSILANALIEGMREAGMASTGKHFPGHGAIAADSHIALPIDSRPFQTIKTRDIEPFKQVMAGGLNAIMPAHVIYTEVDEKPAGFSAFWLKSILRKQLAFNGVIFSDDLTMEGASVAGGYAGRAESALVAGCDMILVCNNRAGALEALEYLAQSSAKDVDNESSERLKVMKGSNVSTLPALSLLELRESERWLSATTAMQQQTR
jgi:beta-N-acetylhexosaminidase